MKAGESPLVPPMSSVAPTQMEGCVVRPQEAWVDAEKTGKSISVHPRNIAPPIQVARCTTMSQEDCDEVEKAGESLSVSSTSVVKPAQGLHCSDKLRKVCSVAEKDEDSTSMSPMSIELPEKVMQCLQESQKMVESVICDGICAFGCKVMNGGSVSTVIWLSNLIPLPRLVRAYLFNLLMGLLRAGLLGLGDMGGEENAVSHADSLSLSGVSFLAADAMVLSVGFSESEEFSGERLTERMCRTDVFNYSKS